MEHKKTMTDIVRISQNTISVNGILLIRKGSVYRVQNRKYNLTRSEWNDVYVFLLHEQQRRKRLKERIDKLADIAVNDLLAELNIPKYNPN